MSIFKEKVTISEFINTSFNSEVIRIKTSNDDIIDIKKDNDFKILLNDTLEIIISASLDLEPIETGNYSGLSYEMLDKYDCIMYGIVFEITDTHFFISNGGLLSKFKLSPEIKEYIIKDRNLFTLINKV